MLEAATLAGPAAAPCPPAISVHEVAITMALAVGDVATARALAADAPPTALRGAAVELAARWAATRAGDTATNPPGASGLVALAVDAAGARRASDVNGSTGLAKRAAAEVGAAGVDLLNLDACGELGILLQRYGYPHEAADLQERVETLFERLGRPLMWGARLAWAGLEAAVATRRPGDLAVHARTLADAAEAMGRLTPLARAAHMWSSVLAGNVHPSELDDVVNALKEGGFVWEAAQLAGQAAIRVDDAALAKSLLGRARSLRQASGGDEEGAVTPAGLSEREREVGRLVLDGLTHKDIGATLYISPKTVEHHVAHIRQKLGTSSRAEFLAALRTDLEAAGG
jgi:DNA-binding CsgD family transcriptional regulator